VSSRPVVSSIVLTLSIPVIVLACAGAPAAPPMNGEVQPAPPAPPAPSATVAPAPVASAAAVPSAVPSSPGFAAVCPAGQALASDGNCKAPAPCLDGEEMMGACICPRGKSVDETGHCVYAKCPEGTSGGTVFRNDSGDCMECRPGTVPCSDHCCPGRRP
jgi:hypothetical protein